MSDLTFLRRLDAWQSLTPAEAKKLLKGTDRTAFAAGETILKRGDPGDAMYVIARGQVEIRVADDEGRPRFTTHMETGDIFGEMSLLTGEPRSADVIATTDCECLVISQARFEASLRQHPALAAFLSYVVSRRILESDTLRQVGKYHVLGELGQGNMAIVFEGFHPGLNRRVAIKMLSHALVYTQGVRKRFLHEAKVVASLHHENIVQVYDIEEAYGTWFIIMEYIQGTDLEQHLNARGPLSIEEVRRVAHDVSTALIHAHDAGVVHRDIKPANIIRDASGRCRLTDFGIATSDVNLENEGDLFCSPAYVAPEAIRNEFVDWRADLYSLGATLYRLLTGRSPYPYTDTEDIFRAHQTEPFPDAQEITGPLPDDIAWILSACTEKRPQDRVQHAREIVERTAPLLATVTPTGLRVLGIQVVYPDAQREHVGRIVEGFTSALREIGSEAMLDYEIGGEEKQHQQKRKKK